MSLPLHSPSGLEPGFFAVGDSAHVRLELWRSLVSILRGYALDPNLAEDAVTVTEFAPAEAIAVCGKAKLTLSLDLTSGMGEWKLAPHLEPGDEGSFQLSEAGTVNWNREEKEFDLAGIEWVGILIHRRKRLQEMQTL